MKTENIDSKISPQVIKADGGGGYSDPSWWYDFRGFFLLMITYRVMIWNHFAFFAKNIGNRHLEAAIGSGTFFAFTIFFQKLKGGKTPEEIVGIDYAERMLNGAKKLFKNKKNIKLLQADLCHIDYPSAYFDSVNIAHSFHALPNTEKVLKELYRVMKPEAKLYADILLTPQGGFFLNYFANRANRFGFKIGILSKLWSHEEAKSHFEENKFLITESYIKGNTYHVIAIKK
jgi:ubiquinone/menaquinone biosynthesis C-methylase UbiE